MTKPASYVIEILRKEAACDRDFAKHKQTNDRY